MSRVITVTLTDHGRALVAEAVGTFMFLAIGVGSVVANFVTEGALGPLGIAFANGLALAVAISCFGAISGGHFNPAVTLALWIADKHPRERVLTYWAAQVAGALAAGIFLRIAFGHHPAAMTASRLGTPILGVNVDPLQAIFIELVLTVFLVWAVFGTVVSPNAPRLAGFGIGLMVTAETLAGGPLTGAAMNPARWIGPAAASAHFDQWYVYLIGPLLGGALAGLSYKYFFASGPEREPIVLPTPVPPEKDRTERI